MGIGNRLEHVRESREILSRGQPHRLPDFLGHPVPESTVDRPFKEINGLGEAFPFTTIECPGDGAEYLASISIPEKL